MRSRWLVAGILAVVVGLTNPVVSRADFVQYGTPGNDGNAFPFGGNFNAGTRYQQVYNLDTFTPSGVVNINTVSFFHTFRLDGTYRRGTYDFYLSTTPQLVNGLDTSNLNNNPGPDARLVGSYSLDGTMPVGVVPFALTTPFTYDPTLGNLLLDIRYDGPGGTIATGYFDAEHDSFGLNSSRAHDYGTGFEFRGLVTRFDFTPGPVNAVPAPPALALLLLGYPLAGFAAIRRRRIPNAVSV